MIFTFVHFHKTFQNMIFGSVDGALNSIKIGLLEKKIINEEFLKGLDEDECCAICCCEYKLDENILFL